MVVDERSRCFHRGMCKINCSIIYQWHRNDYKYYSAKMYYFLTSARKARRRVADLWLFNGNIKTKLSCIGFSLKTPTEEKNEIDKLHINEKPISYRIQQYQFHAFSLTTRRVFAFETLEIESFEKKWKKMSSSKRTWIAVWVDDDISARIHERGLHSARANIVHCFP